MDMLDPTGPSQRAHLGRGARALTRDRGVQRARVGTGRGVLRVLTRGQGAGRVIGSTASAH